MTEQARAFGQDGRARREEEVPDFLEIAGRQLKRAEEALAKAEGIGEMGPAQVFQARLELGRAWTGLASIQYSLPDGDGDEDGFGDYRD